LLRVTVAVDAHQAPRLVVCGVAGIIGALRREPLCREPHVIYPWSRHRPVLRARCR